MRRRTSVVQNILRACGGAALLLGAACAGTTMAVTARGGGGGTIGAPEAHASARELGRALARLGAPAGRDGAYDLHALRDGSGWEARSPDEGLASGMFGGANPKLEEIDQTFSLYCRATAAPKREQQEGYLRVTLQGVERKSGSECTLVADVPKTGRWRFVLRIRRPG